MSRLARASVLVLTGLIAAACAAPRPTQAPSQARTQAPSPIASPGLSVSAALTVVARDLSFTPRELAASTSAPVTLAIENDGRVVHNLTIDELGVQVVVSPGQTGSQQVTDIPAGTYTYYCSVSGHRQAGMFGTLTVR